MCIQYLLPTAVSTLCLKCKKVLVDNVRGGVTCQLEWIKKLVRRYLKQDKAIVILGAAESHHDCG